MLSVQLTLLLLTCTVPPGHPWLVQQPKENVWVTLAKALKQENMFLSMSSAHDSISTCLVGVLLQLKDNPWAGQHPDPADSWDLWLEALPHAPQEPQELDILVLKNKVLS